MFALHLHSLEKISILADLLAGGLLSVSGHQAMSRSSSSSNPRTLFKLFNIKAIIIMRLICHEHTITTTSTWGHGQQ